MPLPVPEQALPPLESATEFYRLTVALAGALTPADVASAILTYGRAVLGADAGIVAMLSEDGGALELLGSVGYPPALVAPYTIMPLDAPLVLCDTARIRQPILIKSREEAAARYPHLESVRSATSLQSWANLPLIVDDRLIGAMELSFCVPWSFPPAIKTLLQALVALCAQALERARLYAAERAARATAERAMARMLRLQQITAELAIILTPIQVAEVIVQAGCATLGARAGSLALLSDDGTMLEIITAIGYPPSLIDTWLRFPLASNVPFSEAVRTGTPIFLENRAARMARYPELGMTATEDHAWAALPLQADGRVLGGLGLSFAAPHAFSDDDSTFMQSLAQQCAQALARAQLYAAEQQARRDAEEAIRMRDTFFSIAAHELRTPLTSLLGQAQLVQRRMTRGGPLVERDQRAVHVVVGQAQRLSRMVSALLDLSRIDQGQLQLEVVALDLHALVQQVVAEVEPTLERHRIEYQGSSSPLLVCGDPLRLEQVVQNLIHNAIKYSPAGGSVMVHLEQQDAMASMSITDQGIGIPADALPQLFQRFYRAPNATAQHIGGTGIGLYVVKEIVALHQGTITVTSQEGIGTTFTVMLPLRCPSV